MANTSSTPGMAIISKIRQTNFTVLHAAHSNLLRHTSKVVTRVIRDKMRKLIGKMMEYSSETTPKEKSKQLDTS